MSTSLKILTPTNDNVGITVIFEAKVDKNTLMKITDDRTVAACSAAGDDAIGHCFVSPRADGGEGTVSTRFGHWVKAKCDGAIVAGAHVQVGDNTSGEQRLKTYAGSDPRVDKGVCLVGAGDEEEGEFLLY